MKHIYIMVGIAAIACCAAFAQEEQPKVVFLSIDDGAAKTRVEDLTVNAFRNGGVATARFGMMGPPVKGAPYSADGVTEFSHTLADGTHISRQETYKIYRDGEGRIRRETDGQVWISDPVAGATYLLDTREQSAHKMPLSKSIAFEKMKLDKVTAETAAKAMALKGVMLRKVRDDKTESLGKQEMEGVEVEGSRNTTVIPPGQIGNDRELQMVHERWESTELHVTILSKHTDPMVGDSVERLTNVRRGEPDPALFQVPAGYQNDSGQ